MMNRAMMIRLRPLPALAVALLVGGCASTAEDVIPQDGPDMRTIYETHMRASGAGTTLDPARDAASRRRIDAAAADLRGFTREADTEITQRFPLLPNPHLVIYVHPHLSGEGAPVPGYTTAVPMYPVDQYALPGEIAR